MQSQWVLRSNGMIAVDTNIIVRLLTQDDEAQFQKSVQIFLQI
jgi:predicted nucleic-acid-binding protein